MTRTEFTDGVFARDKHTCVVPGCGAPAVDAHHIMERRIWRPDDPYPEGYLLENGASVCEKHHLAAESNAIPPQAFRHWLKLPTVLPAQLDSAGTWDKWGNPIPCGVLHKYPRTPYFNFSESQDQQDDCIDNQLLLNKPLVVTIKMDGSNVQLTRTNVAARNGQLATHASFDYLKSLHAGFRFQIPEGVQIFGEWLYAKHSIHYKNLESHLQVFGIFDGSLFWAWDAVEAFCKENGFHLVEKVACVEFDAEWKLVNEVYSMAKRVMERGHEGLVVKSMYPFHHGQHASNSAKIVRPNHITTDSHWSSGPIIKNLLKQ